MSASELSPSSRAASMSMLLDACAAEVTRRFERAEIDSMLLRGPVIAAWLYGEDEPRPYTDVDLLVSPRRIQAAESVLEQIGFSILPLPPHDQHARTWVRSDGASIDLHRSLWGVQGDAELVWHALARDARILTVHGHDMKVPRHEACALGVALHVAQHGRQLEHPLEDLRRALARAETAVWHGAGELAAELGALPAFAAGMRRLPSGSQLTDRLGLPVGEQVATVLRSGNPPSMALGLDWLATRDGTLARLRFAGSKLVPSPAFMRAWSRLANRGRLGLGAAYVQRLGWLAWHAGPAIRAWLRARREARPKRGPA